MAESATNKGPRAPGGRRGRLRHLNRLRRAVQVAVVLFVLAVPVLSLYQSYSAAHAIQWMTGPEKWFFEGIDDLVRLVSDRPAEDLDVVKGSLWAARFGSFKISDPLAVVGQAAAERRVHWPFVLTALLPVAITVLLGRVFCGWICPAYLLYEIGDGARQLVYRAGFSPRNIALPAASKYVALGLGVALSLGLGLAVFPMVYPPALIGREWFYWVFYGAFGGGLTLLAVTVVLETTLSRRVVCRHLCPGGALYSLLGKFRVVRIRRRAAACIDCVLCDDVCGLGLNPMTDRTGMECNNCAACIAACPTDALTIGLGWQGGPVEGGGLRQKNGGHGPAQHGTRGAA
ncbi:MAG: 4Fe-4S binding protein [bacterium]